MPNGKNKVGWAGARFYSSYVLAPHITHCLKKGTKNMPIGALYFISIAIGILTIIAFLTTPLSMTRELTGADLVFVQRKLFAIIFCASLTLALAVSLCTVIPDRTRFALIYASLAFFVFCYAMWNMESAMGITQEQDFPADDKQGFVAFLRIIAPFFLTMLYMLSFAPLNWRMPPQLKIFKILANWYKENFSV